MAASKIELSAGSTLNGGKYKIVRTLGQGSFGITYLATMSIEVDGQLGKIDVNVNVAIKEFFMSDLNSRSADGTSVEKTDSSLVKNYRTKFRREAENLSKLHHPNIVKVLEVFEDNNTTYYVMEFIEGESLDDYIKRQGKLPEEEALSVAQNICLALSYMHGHKMLHLDLKPKNIMREREGHIRLIDFGLSKQYNEKGEPESSTTLGLGTPGYAPIEQAHYKQDGTFPVTLDIYALGATLYKMLTGKTPPEATMMVEDGFPLDVLKLAGVSADVTAIVEKAMALAKKNRYQTVASLSQAIAAVTSEEHTEDEQTSYQNGKDKAAYVEPEIKKDSIKERQVPSPVSQSNPSIGKYLKYGIVALVMLLGIYVAYNWNRTPPEDYGDVETPISVSKPHNHQNQIQESINSAEPITNSAEPITPEVLIMPVEGNGKTVTFRMKKVEAGRFQMGSNIGDSDEKPVHWVSISKDYYMGETEVTQALWYAVMGYSPTSNGSQWESSYGYGDNYPAYYISYEDCQDFIWKLNRKTGKNFRLPTEAEWEFAARGGNQSREYTYAGSNTIEDVAWYKNNSWDKGRNSYDYGTHLVAQKQPNELGLYDMSGNVYEWCKDWYGSYVSVSQTDPTGPSSGSDRVYRGGSWRYEAKYCRSAFRGNRVSTTRNFRIGFRLAL